MKKKNIIIMSVTFVVLLIGVIILALIQKNNKAVAVNKTLDSYEVTESIGEMYKGMSVISDKQSIFAENMLTIEQVHIEDKSEVKKGDIILTYFNDSIQEQIDSLEMQYNSTNIKLERENGNKAQATSEIAQKEDIINKKTEELNSLNNIEEIDKKTALQQEIAEEQQELQL